MKYILAIWTLIYFSAVHGQATVTHSDRLNESRNIHKEVVFVHQSASLLFVGEKLYYKMYCLDAVSGSLSPMSKIGYVELVGPDKTFVFRHKIRLSSGLGKGDFFIPTNLPTGNYKLLGYTHWMRNNSQNKYFMGEVNIVNLYLTDENSIAEKDTLQTENAPINNTEALQGRLPYTHGNLSLDLNKVRFKQREMVRLTISAISGSIPDGNYSLSISHKDEIFNTIRPKTSTSSIAQTAIDTSTLSDAIYLPETRGELVYGQIVPKKAGSTLANIKIGLSIPGKDFIFKIANSNAGGGFYFNLQEHYDNENALVQILGDHKNDYTLVLRNNLIDPVDFIFDKLGLKKEMKKSILSRSIHNQLQNAYLEVKQDTLVPITTDVPFYGDFSIIYDLDDFTRFPSIRETLVEVIENVWIRKDINGESFFQVRGGEYFTSSDFLPLVLVDGIMIQNHSDIIDIDARSIKKIGVLRDKYQFGLHTFQGILSFESFEGNFQRLADKNFIQKIELTPPLPEKSYFSIDYDPKTQIRTDRIPDYRYQLLWLPELTINENNSTIEFFTSDITGKYEVSMEGFTVNGEPISIYKTFDVE